MRFPLPDLGAPIQVTSAATGLINTFAADLFEYINTGLSRELGNNWLDLMQLQNLGTELNFKDPAVLLKELVHKGQSPLRRPISALVPKANWKDFYNRLEDLLGERNQWVHNSVKADSDSLKSLVLLVNKVSFYLELPVTKECDALLEHISPQDLDPDLAGEAANAGGALPISDLISRYGVSSQTIALLCDEEQHTDKRRKVRARLGDVDGVPVVWLTASGHQASGKSRGFEVRPTSDSLGHALGPSRLAKWIDPLTSTLSPYGIELSVTWGPSCQAFSRRTEALAWARLKTQGDQTGDVGVLTGGLIPDALLIERRPVTDQGTLMFEQAWKRKPYDRDEVAETVIAIEVQNATRQASDPLRSKVDAWSAAVENLKVASIVLWIVEPAACKVLASLGVGDLVRRPGQILISSGAVGLGGDFFEVPGPRWWVLDVPRQLAN